VITNPDWARRPTGEDIARYYPDRAQRMEVEGRATLSCTVNARGTLGRLLGCV
jgi:protein TonB